jgi:hypothetical protein
MISADLNYLIDNAKQGLKLIEQHYPVMEKYALAPRENMVIKS